MSKSARLILRIEPEQLAQFQEAAKVAGKNVSDWLRDAGSAAAAHPNTIGDMAVKQPFNEIRTAV